MFVAIEGMDLSGKSTFTNLLKTKLESFGFKVLTTREPGGTNPICSSIRDILVNNDLDQMTQMLLFQANRTLHNNTVIKPALESDENVIVLSDRYFLATYVYQHDHLKLALNISKAAKHLDPDLTILVWANQEEVVSRMRKRAEEGGEVNYLDTFFTKDYQKYQTLYFKALECLQGDSLDLRTDISEGEYTSKVDYIATLIKSRANALFESKSA